MRPNEKKGKFYHGTAAIFEDFSAENRGDVTQYPGADQATFFAALKADAMFYAYKSEAYHQLSNLRSNPRIITVEIDLSNLLMAEDDYIEIDGESINIDDDVSIFAAARAEGYQGVRFPYGNANNAGDTIAVFDLSIVEII